jgi:hypothetical protein
MPFGAASVVVTGYSAASGVAVAVSTPIFPVANSVNQTVAVVPAGPAVMPKGLPVSTAPDGPRSGWAA